MLIFGVHRMMIGFLNFMIEEYIQQSNIHYNWIECIIISLIIEIILLPTIFKNLNRPFFFGKPHSFVKKI
jgi:hypothetical protein